MKKIESIRVALLKEWEQGWEEYRDWIKDDVMKGVAGYLQKHKLLKEEVFKDKDSFAAGYVTLKHTCYVIPPDEYEKIKRLLTLLRTQTIKDASMLYADQIVVSLTKLLLEEK